MASIKGRLLNITIGIVTGGVFSVKAAPHLFPYEFCRRIAEWKPCRNGSEPVSAVAVPTRCQVQLDRVLQKLGKDNHCNNIQLFICNGYSPISAGAVWLPNGVVIGLPKYFLFEKEDDIIASGLSFRNRAVNWKTKLGSTLASSLIATDDNVAFLIGHELAHIQGSHMLYDAVLSPTWLYATYWTTFGRSTSKSVAGFTLRVGVCCLSYLMYVMTSRWIKVWQEYAADRCSAELDVNMALGGVDFTLKKLKLNSVLRVLYGSDGKKMFSEKGEILKNTTHPKLSERLRILEEITANKMEKIYQDQIKTN